MTAFLRTSHGWPYLLVQFILIAVVLDIAGAPAVAVFSRPRWA